MKKLKELTLKEYTDLRRSGLMLIVFPDATGDFREDCEEVKKVKDKCEWKDGKFEGCFMGKALLNAVDLKLDIDKGIDMKGQSGNTWHFSFCPFCGVDIRKPEPVEPLIVKSGGTWVAHWEGVDYLWMGPDNIEPSFTPEYVNIASSWVSFTGPNPDITELTPEICKSWPMVIHAGKLNKLYGIDDHKSYYLLSIDRTHKVSWIYKSYCRLATAQELKGD